METDGVTMAEGQPEASDGSDIRLAHDGDAPPAAPAEQAPPSPPPAEDPLARARADIERRDRELLERAGELRGRQALIDEWQQIKELARKSPAEAVRRLGIDPLAALEGDVMRDAPPDPLAKIGGLEEQIQKLQQQLAEQNHTRTVDAEYQKISGALRARAEDFPLLARLAQEGDSVVQDVFGRAADYYQKTGQVPDYATMLAEAEEAATGQVVAYLTKIMDVPKLKTRASEMISGPQTPAAAPPQRQTPAAAPQKSLTAALTQEPRHETRQETDEEREAAAREMIAAAFAQMQR